MKDRFGRNQLSSDDRNNYCVLLQMNNEELLIEWTGVSRRFINARHRKGSNCESLTRHPIPYRYQDCISDLVDENRRWFIARILACLSPIKEATALYVSQKTHIYVDSSKNRWLTTDGFRIPVPSHARSARTHHYVEENGPMPN